ncbi:hypothetical protein N1851_014621 [Merluccius polli]|uniref:Uncharacterized protein n=1 Tax=Merluccius polli TaxID=89951 RepID=A0AA47MTY2_MERPO|nr:hypothetical protein N1851_014621 [Merluccius polli]
MQKSSNTKSQFEEMGFEEDLEEESEVVSRMGRRTLRPVAERRVFLFLRRSGVSGRAVRLQRCFMVSPGSNPDQYMSRLLFTDTLEWRSDSGKAQGNAGRREMDDGDLLIFLFLMLCWKQSCWDGGWGYGRGGAGRGVGAGGKVTAFFAESGVTVRPVVRAHLHFPGARNQSVRLPGGRVPPASDPRIPGVGLTPTPLDGKKATETTMGSQASKGEVAAEATAAAAADGAAVKTNGQEEDEEDGGAPPCLVLAVLDSQPSSLRAARPPPIGAPRRCKASPFDARLADTENGHVKTNGDVKADGETTAATNGSAEAAKEPGAGGDAIEPAPAADGEAAKADAGAAKETPKKKKKKFFLKKSFNFKLNLKKSKKGGEAVKEEAAAGEVAAAAGAAAEEKPAENGAAVEEKKEEVKEEAAGGAAAAEAPKAEEAAPAKEEAPKEEAKEEAAPAPEATKPTEETSSSAAPSEKKE